MSDLLEFKDVSVSYGGIQALRNISFAIPRGRIVTILGAQLGIILKLMHSSATPAQLARELMEGELTRLKLEQAQAQAASPVSINTNVEGPSS